MVQSILMLCSKKDVLYTIHNLIILYQQLSSWDLTFCVNWPGMHTLENLYGISLLSKWVS